jgi:hypothetical protein
MSSPRRRRERFASAVPGESVELADVRVSERQSRQWCCLAEEWAKPRSVAGVAAWFAARRRAPYLGGMPVVRVFRIILS